MPDLELFRKALREVVQNQIRDRNPPETKETYDRLRAAGHGHDESMGLLATAVLDEMNQILRSGEAFNRTRFVAGLRALPELPGSGEKPTGGAEPHPGPHGRASRHMNGPVTQD